MTSGNLHNDSIKELIEAGIDKDDARFDIELLEDLLVKLGEDAFRAGVTRRAQGEPLAYILGERAFYKDVFKVVPGVLVPRNDTELLVEAALRFMGLLDFPLGDVAKVTVGDVTDGFTVIDLCTGTGCIGISIANEATSKGKSVQMTMCDLSPVALRCAQDNASTVAKAPVQVKEFDVLNGDYSTLVEGEADIIVSNPPYITDDEMEELPYDVKNYEPDIALRAADNGLEFYKAIATKSMPILKNTGMLAVEHGYLQGEAVRDIFAHEGYIDILTLKDYGGNDRVTIGRKI